MSDSEQADAAASPKPSTGLTASWPAWARIGTRVVLRGLGALLAAFAAGAILVGIALAVAYPNLPDVSGLTDYRPKLPMRLYSSDGVLLGEYGEEKRHYLPISKIPKVMQEAVLSIEDARFYQHSGVDYVGILRAGMANFGELRSQGASTITMQVARNFYLSTEKTFTRKIYEILLALKIESQLSKQQILELYMNQIYLGQRAYGFAAASETYFGKPLSDVTVAEAAMLAGLPKAPSAYNPIANPERATRRQQYIIDRMLENGYITQAEHDAARKQVLQYRTQNDVPVHAEYVADAARQLVFDRFGEAAYTQGLNVYLTVDAKGQEVAYHALRKGLMNYERRQVYRGPEAYIDLPADHEELDTRIAEALADHPDDDDLRAAVVTEASPKKVVAVLQSGDAVTITGAGLKPVESGLSPKAGPKVQIRPGAIVRVIEGPKPGQWTLTQVPEVEGAFVAMDPQSGAVRALVGGFDYSKSKFDHVTQAWRQPGSSFKPFIYSAALEKGFTPATVINDAPLFFDSGVTGSQPWEPKNYDGTYDGPMSMRRALAESKNMVSIRILQAIGPQYAQQWITRFGLDPDKHPAYLTMALGAGSVTPMQMAAAYSVFANTGYRVTPMLITKVTDTRGHVLFEARPPQFDDSQRTLDARNAFIMDSLLNEVARSGTAARAQATLKRPDLYGKTGTTNDSMDAWFCGFQPHLVAVVWIGYDTPRNLGSRETGGGLALPVWIDYMSYALHDQPVEQYQPPDGVVNIGGEWFYEEYSRSTGIATLGMNNNGTPGSGVPAPAASAASETERKTILDLFKQ